MGNAIKLGVIIGGSFAAGDIGGAKLADAMGIPLTSVWARRGVKIGTGIATYVVLASVLA